MYAPPWPKTVSRRWFTAGRVKPLDRGLEHALRLSRRNAAIRASGATQTYQELIFKNTADYNAVSTTASEASLLGGVNQQPVINAFGAWNANTAGKSVSFLARGVLSTTSTPTIVFQWRLGTAVGSSSLSGASVGVSAAITTASGVTNKWWESRLDLVVSNPGLGSGNATLQASGYVASPGGFASPFVYPLEVTTPDTATWTQVFDTSVTNYVNLSVTWGTSSSSNTITCKLLKAWLEN